MLSLGLPQSLKKIAITTCQSGITFSSAFIIKKNLKKKAPKKNNQRTNIKPRLAQKDGPPIGPIIVTAEKKDTGSETTRTA